MSNHTTHNSCSRNLPAEISHCSAHMPSPEHKKLHHSSLEPDTSTSSLLAKISNLPKSGPYFWAFTSVSKIHLGMSAWWKLGHIQKSRIRVFHFSNSTYEKRSWKVLNWHLVDNLLGCMQECWNGVRLAQKASLWAEDFLGTTGDMSQWSSWNILESWLIVTEVISCYCLNMIHQ